jgi:hypothetical protein
MGVEILKIPDPTVEAEVLDALTEAGFDPFLRGAFIVLTEGLPKLRTYRGVLIDSTRIEGHCHYLGGSVIPLGWNGGIEAGGGFAAGVS